MKKIISGITLSLVSLAALAQEAIVPEVPQVDSDPTAMIIFAVLFVGMIGVYAFVIWRNERKKKDTTE